MFRKIYNKIYSVISENPYLFFVGLLLFLAIALSLFSSFLGSFFVSKSEVSNDTINGPLEQVENYYVLDETDRKQIEDVYTEFVNVSYYTNENYTSYIPDATLSAVNKSTYIYSYTNSNASFLQNYFEGSQVSVPTENVIRIEGLVNLTYFINMYMRLLNNSLTQKDSFFALSEVSTDLVGISDYHFDEAVTSNLATHAKHIYEIKLNGYLFNSSQNKTIVVVFEDLDSGVVRADIPNFIPDTIVLDSYKPYSGGDYTFIPSVASSDEFTSFASQGLARLKVEDVNFESSIPELVYIYDSSTRKIIPLLSLKGILTSPDFEYMDDRGYYFSTF